MNIAIFDLEVWKREGFERLAGEHDLTLLAEPLSPENAGRHGDAEVVSGFVYSSFGDQVMEQLDPSMW